MDERCSPVSYPDKGRGLSPRWNLVIVDLVIVDLSWNGPNASTIDNYQIEDS
jgi:hypothetical protein